MAQHHTDRLTATDAGFLHQETPSAHMHIGGVLVFEGAAPPMGELIDHVRGRLHLLPRYRQKLAVPPAGTGRPLWVDDPAFDLAYHVRHAVLPPPGAVTQLLELVGQIASAPLERSRPLWELWLVEGIGAGAEEEAEAESETEGDERAPERFALILKSHHALVDGVSGVDLATVLLDVSPEPRVIDTTVLGPWRAQTAPEGLDLIVGGLRESAAQVAELARGAVSAARQPERTRKRVRDGVEGVGELVLAALDPAPATPLNVPIGPQRRYAVVQHDLSDYRRVKAAFGGTVNDVLLTVVSGALGGWLRTRGVDTRGMELRALVPVSVRRSDEHQDLGNRLTVMRGLLPVAVEDPVRRMQVVSAAMHELKRSKQALGASALVAAGELAPAALLARTSRIRSWTRLFNLLVTNVPGPQLPLYILGRRMTGLFPVPFLPDGHALAVAMMSYDGGVGYGLLADFDALADLGVITEGIDAALVELVAAAGQPGHRDRSSGA